MIFIVYYMTVEFCSMKGDEGQQFIYGGDRQAEDIVHFALRVANPAIRLINDHEDIKRLKKDGTIFFAFIGDASGKLWVSEILVFLYFMFCMSTVVYQLFDSKS